MEDFLLPDMSRTEADVVREDAEDAAKAAEAAAEAADAAEGQDDGGPGK